MNLTRKRVFGIVLCHWCIQTVQKRTNPSHLAGRMLWAMRSPTMSGLHLLDYSVVVFSCSAGVKASKHTYTYTTNTKVLVLQ